MVTDLVIELQGAYYSTPGKYSVKELAVLSLDGCYEQYVMFKPQTPFNTLCSEEKKMAMWLTNTYHGIPYESGTVPYSLLPTMFSIVQLNTKVYAKGCEKSKFLSLLLNKNVYNVETMFEWASLKQLRRNATAKHLCIFHAQNNGNICALNDAHIIRNKLCNILA